MTRRNSGSYRSLSNHQRVDRTGADGERTSVMAEQFGTDPWPPVPQEGREAFVPLSSARSTAAGALQQAQRTWLPVLTLCLLAPLIAEMSTGSTPPLMWNNVGGIILTTGLYGSGALLARELIRRRGLGWSSLALLGAAYGVLEEGLAFQSWFNPTWAGSSDASRFLEANSPLVGCVMGWRFSCSRSSSG